MVEIILCAENAYNAFAVASSGYVHSVYRKTVNIICDKKLLAIQAADTVVSPLSMISALNEEALRQTGIRQGARLEFDEQGTKICGLRVSFERCKILDSRLDVHAGMADAAYIRHCLAALMPTGGFSDIALPDGVLWRKSAAAVEARNILDNARKYAGEENIQMTAEALCGLVGLGEGLTPSGDDFICGVLACGMVGGRRLNELRDALSDKLQGRLDMTNDISAAFLKCACDGLFSQPVQALQREPDPEYIINSFASIGHSSGADTLSGVLFALTL